MSKRAIVQPKFDYRIYGLKYPLTPDEGVLKRGLMVWRQPISGFSDRAQMHFLYNPSTVEADFALSDASVGSSLLFPNPNDTADLRVPLQQTVSFSVLFDRTYELWGSYDKHGKPRHAVGRHHNNPKVVGVMADIMQMEQFTGMTVGYNSMGITTKKDNLFAGNQGILQLIPSHVYFGDARYGLAFYGYISEWTAQVTHWNQFMIPMRCVITVSFTLLPPPNNQNIQISNGQSKTGKSNWGGIYPTPSGKPLFNPIGVQKSGVSGR